MASIYEMKLHETIIIKEDNYDTLVRRVHKGWIYTICSLGNDMGGSVFVPMVDGDRLED